jgi:hypothetical protein
MSSASPNDSLSRSLADWRVEPSANPNFRPAVWARVRDRSRQTWAAYVHSHLAAWGLATACIIALSGWAGLTVGKARLDAARDEMVVAYLVELDPRVQARLHP